MLQLYSIIPAQIPKRSYITLFYQNSLQSVLILYYCTNTPSRVLLKYSSVQAQPRECSFSTLLYQHSLPSAKQIHLYQHSLPSSPVILVCTSKAALVLLQYSTIPTQPSKCFSCTLLYQYSLPRASIVLCCTSISSQVYQNTLPSAPIVPLYFCAVPALPPECSYSTLLYQHSLTSAPVVLFCTNRASPALLE